MVDSPPAAAAPLHVRSKRPIDVPGGGWSRDALASGLGDALLAAAGIAGAGVVVALVVLPRASAFLPRLRAAPAPVSMH